MKENTLKKDTRNFIGSMVIFSLMVGLLIFLAFVEIPSSNNDTFKLIIGMITGSLSVVMYTIVGKDTGEVEALKSENTSLKEKNEALTERVDHLEEMFLTLQSQIIGRLSELTQKNK